MTAHVSRDIVEDRAGFITVRCSCNRFTRKGLPDMEIAVDVLMEHAYEMGVRDGRKVKS